jgi:hypothetical protein
MYKKISCCRICGNTNLVSLLKLGEQTLTGVFPKSKSQTITSGPLELVKCYANTNKADVCGLVQLNHSYDSVEMYGENYGYRSGLNQSMVTHLHSIVSEIQSRLTLMPNDIIIDIGGNDATLLSAYPSDKGLKLMVIDPTGQKFKKYHPPHIGLVADFFSSKNYNTHFAKKAKVITSIAMFYDLESPLNFVKDIYDILDDNGIWVFEQSYLPSMVETNSYDTICHEHLEYYGLKQIKWLCDKVGFKMIDVDINNINGGSFRITVSKTQSTLVADGAKIARLLDKENSDGYNALDVYSRFSANVIKHKEELTNLIKNLTASGKKIFGYGASTKGNVLLQYCGFTNKDIPCIAEVNEDKFGAYTPQTHIEIVSEKIAREQNPDYFLVLPWHFRDGIIKREQDFLNKGGKLIFPLPQIEIVSK